MRIGRAFVVLMLVMASAAAYAAPKRSYKPVVERAWAAALKPQNAQGKCWAKIGRDPALALTKYCVQLEPSLHARCFSGNPCEMLTDQIWGWCKDRGDDPGVRGQSPDPKVLPCAAEFEGNWDQVQRTPAY